MPSELHGAANWCGYEGAKVTDGDLLAMNETQAWVFASEAEDAVRAQCVEMGIPFNAEGDDYCFTAELMHAYWEWLQGGV